MKLSLCPRPVREAFVVRAACMTVVVDPFRHQLELRHANGRTERIQIKWLGFDARVADAMEMLEAVRRALDRASSAIADADWDACANPARPGERRYAYDPNGVMSRISGLRHAIGAMHAWYFRTRSVFDDAREPDTLR